MNDLVDTTPDGNNVYLSMTPIKTARARYQRTNLVIWGLCGFIMLFAVINLVNTLIATTLSRKHEFSVLRSVGMAKKQLRQTVHNVKVSCWLFGTSCITALIGTGVGYGIVRYLNYVGDDTWVWHFPASIFCWIYDSGNFTSCFDCCGSDSSFGEKVYCAAVERDRLSN